VSVYPWLLFSWIMSVGRTWEAGHAKTLQAETHPGIYVSRKYYRRGDAWFMQWTHHLCLVCNISFPSHVGQYKQKNYIRDWTSIFRHSKGRDHRGCNLKLKGIRHTRICIPPHRITQSFRKCKGTTQQMTLQECSLPSVWKFQWQFTYSHFTYITFDLCQLH
jgi:hypothetical protein